MEWRLYERATKGGGAIIKSTAGGGATVSSTSSGGGTTATSSGGGGGAHTSEFSSPTFFLYSSKPVQFTETVPFNDHYHAVEVTNHLNHSHRVILPNHTHSVSIPNHSHSINIPAHTHQVELPDHTHELEYGIYEYNKMPTKLTIKVDGKTLPVTSLSSEDVDLIPYLTKDSDGKVTREWHTLEIIPNDLARVTASIATQFFVQSRGGGNY